MPAALSSHNDFIPDTLHREKWMSTISTNNRRNEVQKRHLQNKMLKNLKAAVLAEGKSFKELNSREKRCAGFISRWIE